MLLPKAILGETWGASGPLALVAVLEALRRAVVPPWPARSVAELEGTPDADPRPPRHGLVLDCAEDGRFSAIVVGGPGVGR